jgi:hypothetical protein
MGELKEYILSETNISKLSVYDLLRHTQNANFLEIKDFENIYPISLEINAGVFTKTESLLGFANVAVSQVGDAIISSCSCSNATSKLCEHQAEVIHCILEQRDFRIFFDQQLRDKVCRIQPKYTV